MSLAACRARHFARLQIFIYPKICSKSAFLSATQARHWPIPHEPEAKRVRASGRQPGCVVLCIEAAGGESFLFGRATRQGGGQFPLTCLADRKPNRKVLPTMVRPC